MSLPGSISEITLITPLPSAEAVVAWLEREAATARASRALRTGLAIATEGGQVFVNPVNLRELYRSVLAEGRDLTLLKEAADSTPTTS